MSAKKARNRTYTNGEITIFWRASHCLHYGNCFRELRDVFNPRNRPWVNPNGADSDTIKAVIESCPTEALAFCWNDESKNQSETSPKLLLMDQYLESIGEKINSEEQQTPVKEKSANGARLKICKNGPIVISGNYELVDADGNTVEITGPVSICRCGRSKTPIMCDGSHVGFDFER